MERLVAELVLQREAIRDVADVQQDPVHGRIIEPVLADDLDAAPLALRVAQAQVDRARRAVALGGGADERLREGDVVGVDEVGERAADERRRVVAEDAVHRFGLPAHHRVRSHDRDEVARVTDERAQPMLAAALGGALAVGEHMAATQMLEAQREQQDRQQSDRE